jgi:hypothetical protein
MDDIRKWFESEEGKASLEKSKKDDERRKAHEERWIEKFKKWAEPDMNAAIERLLKWYESDTYVRREYKSGFEPREPFLWIAWEYATKYCKRCDDEKYFNPFTGDAYYIGDYVIQIMHGQGSVLKIEKLKTKKPRSSKKDRIIKMMEERILTEHRKHSKSLPDGWAKIAAGKIYTTLEELE